MENQPWGAAVLGMEYKKSPREIAGLLGWSPVARFLRKPLSGRAVLRSAVNVARHALRSVTDPDYRQRYQWGQLPRSTEATVTFLGKRLTIDDPASFLMAHDEVFLADRYRFQSANSTPLIIDCGAGIGLTVLYFKQRFPKSEAIAFEPDPALFRIFEQNCRSFGIEDVIRVRKAPWTVEGTLTGSEAGVDATRAYLSHATTSGLTVPAVRLRDYLERPVELLRLDLHGAETELLLDCRDVLKNVNLLFVRSYSAVDRPQRVDELLEIIRQSGFRVHLRVPTPSLHPFEMRQVTDEGCDNVFDVFAFRPSSHQ